MSSAEHLRKKFEAELGKGSWNPQWESVLRMSPRLFDSSIELLAVPGRKRYLPAKVQHFVGIAVDGAATHLYLPGIEHHIKEALKEGATAEEIMEVIELTSTLGIHACNIGVPLLVDVLKETNHPMSQENDCHPLSRSQQSMRDEFTQKRGYWHEFWEDFLRLDPEFFKAYLDFSSGPWTKTAEKNRPENYLEPKIKELIYCAFDAAATHLYVPGLRLHMKNVLNYGGIPEEILEVLEIASQLSIHTAHASTPILEKLVHASKLV